MPLVYARDDSSFRNRFMILRGPNYYDSPEGTAPWEKLWGINKYAILSATAISIADCFFVSQTKNIVETMNVVGFYMIPAVSVATTFAAVTFIATNLRGKDDELNYAIGVMGCIPVLHAIKQKQAFTIPATLFLLAAAYLKKNSIMNNWQFFYETIPKTEHYYNYSLVGTVTEWPRRPY